MAHLVGPLLRQSLWALAVLIPVPATASHFFTAFGGREAERLEQRDSLWEQGRYEEALAFTRQFLGELQQNPQSALWKATEVQHSITALERVL